jgi:hypothetical protein
MGRGLNLERSRPCLFAAVSLHESTSTRADCRGSQSLQNLKTIACSVAAASSNCAAKQVIAGEDGEGEGEGAEGVGHPRGV